MLYLLISSIILIVSLFIIYVGKNINMSDKTVPELDIIVDNVDICKEMLKIINNNHTNVEYNKDEKSSLSYYNHSKDVIILKTNKFGSSRIVQIAHECIHTIQKKEFLEANKIFSNIQLVYFLISLIYIIFSERFELLMVSIQLLILMGTLFVKVVIEGDASYRSIDLAEKYLQGKTDKNKAIAYINEMKRLIYNLMPIYYINFFSQGMTMVIINIIVSLIS